MAKSYYKLLLGLGFCFFILQSFAQTFSVRQNFFVKNYTKKELKVSSQNWNIAQDLLGQIYVANNQGVLQYNGNNWDEIILKSGADARSLDSDKSGRIFVGGKGEIGYLYFNHFGKTKFASLTSQLSKNELNFSDVWTTICMDNGSVYFQSPEYIFLFKDGKKIKSFSSENGFHKSFKVGNKVFVRENGKGLLVLNQNNLEPVIGGDIFSDIKIDAFIAIDKSNFLIASRTKGLLSLNLFSVNGKDAVSFKLINNASAAELIQNQVYHGIKSKQGGYVLSTLLNGVYFLDDNFNIVNVLNKENGLKDNKVFQVFEDRNANKWLATETGVSFFESNLPISHWGEREGLEGICEDILIDNQQIYIATGLGLFQFNNQRFEKISDSPIEIWSLLKVNNKIYLGATSGLYQYTNNGFALINEDYTSHLSLDNVGNIIQCGDGFISFYKDLNDAPFKVIEMDGLVTSCMQDKNGDYWIATRDNGIKVLDKKWNLYSLETNSRGLDLNGVSFFYLNDQLLGAGSGGTYLPKLSNGKILFEMFKIDDKISADPKYNVFRISSNINNDIAFISDYEGGKQELLFLKKEGKQYQSNSLALARLVYGRINKILFQENELWLLGDDGLFEYYLNKPFKANSFYPIISNIISNSDTLSFGSFAVPTDSTVEIANQPADFIPTLSYDHHVYKFVYSATAFEDKEHIMYSYYLEGFDAGYSDWVSEPYRNYTNIKEGKYTFHLKARDVYGTVSPETTFTFIVSPPWYRTWPAYFAYGIIAILLVYTIVQLNVKRLKNKNIQLEAIITERTVEIRAQRDEIESQKKEITDSINYAKRIQGAVLPNQKQIDIHYSNAFVLFMPKDIVSGDFYYLNQIEQNGKKITFIAAADCTGHGVPGAFMSMIGLKTLDQAIVDKGETDPSKILYELNAGVNTFLRQNENKTHDGMEIALCAFDYEAMVLKFAMANRPLWLIRNNELIEYKPTKLPIGGVQDNGFNEYTGNEINLLKGDTIYIFSDGFADQFGGTEGKKLMNKRFKEELLKVSKSPIGTQRQILSTIMKDWKGNFEQVDDILVIGIKI